MYRRGYRLILMPYSNTNGFIVDEKNKAISKAIVISDESITTDEICGAIEQMCKAIIEKFKERENRDDHKKIHRNL